MRLGFSFMLLLLTTIQHRFWVPLFIMNLGCGTFAREFFSIISIFGFKSLLFSMCQGGVSIDLQRSWQCCTLTCDLVIVSLVWEVSLCCYESASNLGKDYDPIYQVCDLLSSPEPCWAKVLGPACIPNSPSGFKVSFICFTQLQCVFTRPLRATRYVSFTL